MSAWHGAPNYQTRIIETGYRKILFPNSLQPINLQPASYGMLLVLLLEFPDDFVVDIHVRVHALDVVMVFEFRDEP